TGTTTGPDGAEVPIKNGKIDGDKISFVVTVDFGGMMFDLNYTGVVAADTAKLTIDIMGMPLQFEVKKGRWEAVCDGFPPAAGASTDTRSGRRSRCRAPRFDRR